MFDNIKFVDFNSIFVIAIGLSMAYIVVESRAQDKSFFQILSRIIKYAKNQFLNRQTEPQQKTDEVISSIDFFLNSSELQTETRGALHLISDKAKELRDQISNLKKWFDNKLSFHTKTDFLPVVSYDCFLFGIFFLSIGVFQNKCYICIDGMVEIMLVTLIILTLHCLIFEHIKISGWMIFIKPSVIIHSIIIIAALIIGYIYVSDTLIQISCGWLAISSAIACFIGFILYLVRTVIVNILLLLVIICKILYLDVQSKVDEYTEDIHRYDEELNSIKQQLKNTNIVEDITVAAECANTLDNG